MYARDKKNRKILILPNNPGPVIKTRVITRDLIRDVRIPRKISPPICCIEEGHLKEIMKNACVISQEEKDAQEQKRKEEKEKLRMSSQLRKAKMMELDLIRKENIPLNDLEEEAQKQAEDLCLKANAARQENEEEIRELNQLILASKVQAIRNDQMAEKLIIKEMRKNTEIKLDDMMEKERVEGLLEEENKMKLRKEDAYAAAALLKEQIQQDQNNRILEKEKIDQEGEAMRKHFEKLQLEDVELMNQKKEEQKKFLETLLRDNAEIAKQKEFKKQQSKLEDIRITAYQRHKAAQEEAAEAELKEKKRQREQEIGKLREQQEKASDLQAERDALRARRAQEEKEREYRRKEKEAVLKNKEVQEDLNRHRTSQLENKNRLLMEKAELEKKEYEAMKERNKLENEKEERNRVMKRISNLNYSKELRNQIEAKEEGMLTERRNQFLEGFHRKQEEKIRKQQLDNMRSKKLRELKNYDIPKQYISHIQRKVNLQLD